VSHPADSECLIPLGREREDQQSQSEDGSEYRQVVQCQVSLNGVHRHVLSSLSESEDQPDSEVNQALKIDQARWISQTLRTD
jgi:hypothetical protein